MCGIVGVVDEGIGSDALRLSLDALAHRGPDTHGKRVLELGSARCLLGHTRLRVIDLAPEADQPLANEDETVWVSYNGEIYNHLELRWELEKEGHIFRSRSDTEILVHLYEQMGGDVTSMLGRLRGMFAFALVDLSRRRVVLARDRLGIKPMYYSETPAGLAFASEARTLARLTGHVSINPEALIWYLQWGSVGSVSIFEGVNELPPGHFLIWERGSAHVKTWWSPQPSPIADLARDTTRLVRAALADSVARHLVADRPVGLFLSAGADSHAILRQAAAAADINALTITFPETGDDEGDQAAAHAGAVGARHQTVPITGEEIEQLLPTILGSMDQPTSDGVNTWMVCRAAKEAGMVVALSGIGGDELFGGYPSFRFVPRLAAAQRFLHFVPAGLRRSAAKWLSGIAPGGRASRVLIGAGGYSDAYRAVRGFFAEDGSYPFQTNSSLPQSSLNGDDPDPGNRVMRLELENYLPYQLLRDADSMSMSHSLELRVPLLDDVMVRVALALPPEIRNEKGKALLLRAAGIENSPPKRPFALPFDIWLRGPLRETVRAALLSDELPFADLIDSGFRRRVWEAFEAGRIPWSLPWSIAVLRLWPGANGFSW